MGEATDSFCSWQVAAARVEMLGLDEEELGDYEPQAEHLTRATAAIATDPGLERVALATRLSCFVDSVAEAEFLGKVSELGPALIERPTVEIVNGHLDKAD